MFWLKLFHLRLQGANLLKSPGPLFYPRSNPMKVKVHYMYERQEENRMDIFRGLSATLLALTLAMFYYSYGNCFDIFAYEFWYLCLTTSTKWIRKQTHSIDYLLMPFQQMYTYAYDRVTTYTVPGKSFQQGSDFHIVHITWMYHTKYTYLYIYHDISSTGCQIENFIKPFCQQYPYKRQTKSVTIYIYFI